MAATLHFFCGKAGAGKSTLAAGIAQAQGAVLLSEDVWLARLFGDQMHTFADYVRVAPKLKAAVGPLVVDLLGRGQTVVLDFQANTRDGRRWFRSLFESAGAAHVLHLVDTPDALCLAQIARRNVERPEGSHALTAEDFAHVSSFFQAPTAAEGFGIEVHAPNAGPAPGAATIGGMSELPALPAAPPGRYRHYKGGEYELIGVARHSETLEPLVVYRPLYGAGGLWVRPHAMFFESVEVDGRRLPRFARLP